MYLSLSYIHFFDVFIFFVADAGEKTIFDSQDDEDLLFKS